MADTIPTCILVLFNILLMGLADVVVELLGLNNKMTSDSNDKLNKY